MSTNNICIRGRLRVYRHHAPRLLNATELQQAIRCGDALCAFDDANMVVDQGLSIMRALIAGADGNPTVTGDVTAPGDVDDLFVTEMRVTDQTSPTAAAGADVALEGTTVKAWTGVSLNLQYPDAYTVRFSGLLKQSEANGQTITEEGLFTKTGKLFARILLDPAELKEASFALQFEHDIEVARI